MKPGDRVTWAANKFSLDTGTVMMVTGMSAIVAVDHDVKSEIPAGLHQCLVISLELLRRIE